MMIDWRLRELMALRGIRSTAVLHRRLVDGRGQSPGLSQAQVYRLADGPERLNLATLEALCVTLDTTPAELLTNDTAGVPNRLLQSMLAAVAVAAAHHSLCARAAYESGKPDTMQGHPGDPFGRVLAWLWRSGRRHDAAQLVTDYLAEMRQHNPYAPETDRLTWDDLRYGLGAAINSPYDLPTDEVEKLRDYLEEKAPSYYGASLANLNTP